MNSDMLYCQRMANTKEAYSEASMKKVKIEFANLVFLMRFYKRYALGYIIVTICFWAASALLNSLCRSTPAARLSMPLSMVSHMEKYFQ